MVRYLVFYFGIEQELWKTYPADFPLSEQAAVFVNNQEVLQTSIDSEQKLNICTKIGSSIQGVVQQYWAGKPPLPLVGAFSFNDVEALLKMVKEEDQHSYLLLNRPFADSSDSIQQLIAVLQRVLASLSDGTNNEVEFVALKLREMYERALVEGKVIVSVIQAMPESFGSSGE